MDPGITEIAAQLAEHIPTGADSPEEATQDWRTTLYNARATASMRPLTDLIERSAAPGDPKPAALAQILRQRK